MAEDIKELVKRLRVNMHAYGIAQEAALALEALAGEVAGLNIVVTGWIKTFDKQEARAEAAEAERDRLKAALELIAVVDQGCGGNLTFEEMARSAMQQARKALGDAS